MTCFYLNIDQNAITCPSGQTVPTHTYFLGPKRMSKSEDNPSKNTGLEFHYIKSPAFRVIHAEGTVGGLTPRGEVHVAFFSERPAIPRKVIHALNDDGTLGPEIAREGRDGFVREMDVDVVIPAEAAEQIGAFLIKLANESKELHSNIRGKKEK